MATVLESLAVPRCSAFPSNNTPSPIAAYSVSSPSGHRSLPQFTGLKLRPSRVTRSLGSVSYGSSSGVVRRGGRIVCEAQKTAVEGIGFPYAFHFLLSLLFRLIKINL